MRSNDVQWALEVEYPIANLDGEPQFVGDLDWKTLNDALNEATSEEREYWLPKYQGHRASPYYLEGFDIYNEAETEIVAMHVKGLEIRTDINTSVIDCLRDLQNLFGGAQQALRPLGFQPVISACHPTGPSFEREQGRREFVEWKAAAVTMTVAGIHVNLSLSGELGERYNSEEARRRANYLAPALAVWTLNAPFLHGEPWRVPNGNVGKSSRSFLRSFYREVLREKPGKFGKRLHVSLFDSVPSLASVGAMMEATLALLISDERCRVVADTVRAHNLAEMAKYGFDARVFDGNRDIGDLREFSLSTLKNLESVLVDAGYKPQFLGSLQKVADTETLFTDEMMATYTAEGGNIAATMRHYLEYQDGQIATTV